MNRLFERGIAAFLSPYRATTRDARKTISSQRDRTRSHGHGFWRFSHAALGVVFFCRLAAATETENLDLQILPVPGKVTVDGKFDDWDLSGGIFACGDVENAADRYGIWFHAMYDKDNLYVLGRWMDTTPMNHQGSSKGDYGFNGDCLQFRIVTAPDVAAREVANPGKNAKDAPAARTTHLTCWIDKDKIDVVQLDYGRGFNEGNADGKAGGAQQAFLEFPDHKGYVQEIAIPWKLLTKPGMAMKPGSRLLITLEPNFTVDTGGRLAIKDIFKSNTAINRAFTFMGNDCWGFGALMEKGQRPLRPVRLSDGREFPVHMDQGIPAVDWTGLTKSSLPDGFKTIQVRMPEDGYVSLNLFAPDGTVARQLLTAHFLAKGEHSIKWDGLTTTSVNRPGNPVPAGEYTWAGLYHAGIGLRLRGWAGNSGPAPWAGWGADHGNPATCASAGSMVYVGWSSGEGDKPLVAADLKGNIQWKNIRGGLAGVTKLATDGTTVYAFNPTGQYAAKAIYRVDAKSGAYSEWSALNGTDLTMKQIFGDNAPDQPSGLAASRGKVFVSSKSLGIVAVVDAVTGKTLKQLSVPEASALAAGLGEQVFAVSERSIVSVDVDSGAVKQIVSLDLSNSEDWVPAIALDKRGNLYAAVRGKSNQVHVYAPDGKLLRKIGRAGGRALAGKWTSDGMLNPNGITVDAEGQLWVAEDDSQPRRVSIWDAQTGAFKFEMFGATSYGANGGAINPDDPWLMVGQGCEWRIDPQTGKASLLGTITRSGMGASRFGYGSNGTLYLVTTPGFLVGAHPVRIFERLGDGDWKLRTVLYPPNKESKEVAVWADRNGDEAEQPEEIQKLGINLGGWIQGWYLYAARDLSFYGTKYKIACTGFTACGAPQYDLTRAVKMEGPEGRGGIGTQRGMGSADGKYMLYNAAYGEDHSTNDCYDIASGKLLWTYPSNFTGVHGSHRAVGPRVGMIRGAYDVVGSAKLQAPVGNIWIISTNKGEWHVLTEKGFYLTRLFQGDAMKMSYPEPAVPGAKLDNCPPGAGEEAFGGSISQGRDGTLSVQAGHTSFWNAEVTGLNTIRALPGGKVLISDADMRTAAQFRQHYLEDSDQIKRVIAIRATPTFSGDLEKDFAGGEFARYKKEGGAAVRTVLAWDDKQLYAGWEVKDSTPWVNGADAPEFLYARGDTVDLQLAADRGAAKNRKEAALGDMRISIGSYRGKPTAVVYRKVARDKNPKFFNSGVIKNYEMQSVVVLSDARVEVKIDAANKRYVVEAALPLAALGLKPEAGRVLRGDFGATHGDNQKADTVLRTYWSNQSTGLVSDEVLELVMEPQSWGEIQFK